MATEETRWLFDTSILIDVLRGSQAARKWIDSIPESARFISVITAAELIAGCRNRAEQRYVERELDLYEIVWLSEQISQSALDLYKKFFLSHNVGFLDCIIAATAYTHGFNLATLNMKHFSPFSNLPVKRPF